MKLWTKNCLYIQWKWKLSSRILYQRFEVRASLHHSAHKSCHCWQIQGYTFVYPFRDWTCDHGPIRNRLHRKGSIRVDRRDRHLRLVGCTNLVNEKQNFEFWSTVMCALATRLPWPLYFCPIRSDNSTSQYKYRGQVRCWNCTQNVIRHQSVYHCDDRGGTPNGCIFNLVSPVPTMAHLFGRWRDPAQGHSLAHLNHYRYPLCFLGDKPRPLSANHVTRFSGCLSCYSNCCIYRDHQCT